MAARKIAFISEKASWELEEDIRRVELSALEASSHQWKISLEAHEEDLQACERSLSVALKEAEDRFQAQLASQDEKAQWDKEAALQAMFDQHQLDLDAAAAEKERLTKIIRGLELELANKDQRLATAFELEEVSKGLIAMLHRRVADHDKEVESIKVVHAETTSELVVLCVTHEHCEVNLQAFQSSIEEANHLRKVAEAARNTVEEARRSLLSAVSHGAKIINFKLADMKMTPMALSFGSDVENTRSLDFFFQHVVTQLEGFHKQHAGKVAREVKELAGNICKQDLSRLHHHSPGVDLLVMGKPIDSPTDEKVVEKAVARYVSGIIKSCSWRDVSSSVGGSNRA